MLTAGKPWYAGRYLELAFAIDVVAGFDPGPLAGFLGIDTVLATALEFLGEECTGRVAGIPMLGQEKRERVLRFISEAGEDPKECAFYSDSIFDVPLLESVGHPVAVNPDLRLRRVARSRGWRILSFVGPLPGKGSRGRRARPPGRAGPHHRHPGEFLPPPSHPERGTRAPQIHARPDASGRHPATMSC